MKHPLIFAPAVIHATNRQPIDGAHRLPRRCPPIFPILGCVLLSELLGGCTIKSRILSEPVPTEIADVGWTASGPEGITLQVDRVIVRNTGGSWVRDANWDEYVLTVRNDSAVPVQIDGFKLYSATFPGPAASSTSRKQLEAHSSATLRGLKDAGIVAGAGAASAGAVVAIVGTGGTLLTGATAAAAAAGILVLMPAALVGSTVYIVKRHHRDRNDNALIERKLVERGYNVPLELISGVSSKRSAFFPITPAPTRLILEYTASGAPRQLALDLHSLAGLHLRAPAPGTVGS